jgi:hypothetical protein
MKKTQNKQPQIVYVKGDCECLSNIKQSVIYGIKACVQWALIGLGALLAISVISFVVYAWVTIGSIDGKKEVLRPIALILSGCFACIGGAFGIFWLYEWSSERR